MDGDALPPLAQLQAWRAQGLDRAAPARDSGLQGLVAALQARHGDAPAPGPSPVAPSALTEAREVWAQVRTDSQLRASLHDVPADAGPLNSGMLMHRALHLMRAASPGYLQHFIAYADTLSSLEQLQQAVAPLITATDTPRPAKRAPRKRKPAAS